MGMCSMVKEAFEVKDANGQKKMPINGIFGIVVGLIGPNLLLTLLLVNGCGTIVLEN